MDLAIPCGTTKCSCESYRPRHTEQRVCEGCGHTWTEHAITKLRMRSADNNYETQFTGSIFDIASLALFGCHAIPVRVKILLDRLFASLPPDGVASVLERLGWSPEEYARGYVVQDRQGRVIERWAMCTKEEEALIIEQFARFEETKILSQRLLRAPDTDKHEEPKRAPEKEETFKPLPQDLPIPPFHLMQPPESFFQRHFPPFPGFPVPNLPLSPPLSGQVPGSFQRLHMPQYDIPKQQMTATSPGHSVASSKTEHNGSAHGSVTHDKKQGKDNPGPQTPSESDIDLDSDEEGDTNALNLTKCKKEDGRDDRRTDLSDSQGSSLKQPWNPINSLGTQLINPSTGKKRVQCNVCFKTFCDKGALKIHFSAVHLREMHKCTVEGCNMMFSSRRSRNRHSANPNPKLHSPHLRRKISPHDGRTSQPHPIIMGQNPISPPFPLPPLPQGFHPALLQSMQRYENPHLSSSERLSPKRENDNSSDNDIDDFDEQLSDGLSDGEDEASVDNQSVNDGQSLNRTARKRKSQNPTRLMQVERAEKCDYSSDSDRESKKAGEPQPLDLRDGQEKKIKTETMDDSGVQPDNPLRHLENLSQGRIDELMSRGVLGNLNPYQSFPLGLLAAAAMNDEQKRLQIIEDSAKNEEDDHSDSNRSSPLSEENSECSSLGSSFLGVEVPINKENPRQCIACGKMFQNHFGVKTHYQNVHLKLMHKCTVDGCQAAFPSKRSRDRHSANLNLHRKLLSTSSGQAPGSPDKNDYQVTPEQIQVNAFANGAALRDEILARLYGDPSAMIQQLNPFMPNLHHGALPHPLLLPSYGEFSHLHPLLNNNTKLDAKSEALDDDLHSGDDFECKLCKKSCPSKSSLYGHYERRHSSQLLRCSYEGCQKLFLTQEKWLLHIKNPQSHLRSDVKPTEQFSLNQNVTSSSVC